MENAERKITLDELARMMANGFGEMREHSIGTGVVASSSRLMISEATVLHPIIGSCHTTSSTTNNASKRAKE